MAVKWEQKSDTEWLGYSESLEQPLRIEYSAQFGTYFTEYSRYPHKTLTGAKIAAAKTAHRAIAI